MVKRLVLCITLVLMVLAGSLTGYAAFPIVHKEAIATTEAYKAKPFAERRVPQYVSQVKHAIFPHSVVHQGEKPGWPGIVSIGCSVIAIVALFTIGASFFLLLALAGIIFGAIGVSKKRYTNTGLALAGLILGGLEILLFVAIIAIVITALKEL